MHYFGEHGWGMSMGVWWIIGLVIFLSVLFFILKTGTSKRKRKKERDTLNRRFANGEVDKTEYEKEMQNIAEKERFYQH